MHRLGGVVYTADNIEMLVADVAFQYILFIFVFLHFRRLGASRLSCVDVPLNSKQTKPRCYFCPVKFSSCKRWFTHFKCIFDIGGVLGQPKRVFEITNAGVHNFVHIKMRFRYQVVEIVWRDYNIPFKQLEVGFFPC